MICWYALLDGLLCGAVLRLLVDFVKLPLVDVAAENAIFSRVARETKVREKLATMESCYLGAHNQVRCYPEAMLFWCPDMHTERSPF